MSDGYLPIGTRLRDRYEILAEIGRGGLSVVYRAMDHDVGSDVAIKLLVPPPAAAEVARERLRREVLAVRSLAHASVVRIFDLIEEGPWSLVVMEHVAGPDLQRAVERRGPLPASEVSRIGRSIADALACAHRRGIVHRDLKPRNILLDPEGHARLTDFGSARLAGQESLTQTGAFVGTVEYAAPEVFAGQSGDARSDLYALGLTLYFAGTGKLPARTSPHLPPAAAPQGHHPRALRPELPASLDEAIACATRARPGDRFPTAALLEQALSGSKPAPTTFLPAETIDDCLVCGGAEPFGIGVCPGCSAGPGERTLVAVAPAPDAAARATVERSLTAMFSRAPSTSLRDAARGCKPLLEAPPGFAARVAERLAAQGIHTRTLPRGRALGLLPRDYWVLLAGIAAVGTLAGAAAAPILLGTTPLVLALLLGLGVGSVHRPLWQPASPRLLPALRRPFAALPPVLASLPAGSARSLVADIARTARELLTRDHRREVSDRVGELLGGAAAAAETLAAVDAALGRLEGAQLAAVAPSPSLLDTVSRCQATRDAVLQRMLEALAVLAQAQSEAAESRLAALATAAAELRSDLEVQTAAARELEALLAPERPSSPGRTTAA